jgi:tetratricopeptide (TPR) repeat protein
MRGYGALIAFIIPAVLLDGELAWAQGVDVASRDGISAEASPSGEGSSSRERAKVLYEEGLVAYRAGKYSDAIDKLLEADKVMPHAAFSYNIALVYEAMGDSRSALRWLRRHVRQSGNDAIAEGTWRKVRKFEKELQAQGLQQVTIVSNVDGATVWIDGHALGMSPFTTEIIPGSHSVTVASEGYEPAQKSFELRADKSIDLEVLLSALKEKPVELEKSNAERSDILSSRFTVTGSVVPANSRESFLSKIRPWTWAGLGTGVAMLGGATIFEVKRRYDEDDARHASQVQYQAKWDDENRSKNIARVFLVGGVAVTAVGLSLLTVDLTRGGAKTSASVESCDGLGTCVTMRGRF